MQVRREFACPQVSGDGRWVAAVSTETEPRPEYVKEAGADEWRPFLRDVPGVFLTPHRAGGTTEGLPKMVRLALENVRRFLAGQPVITPIPQ